MLLLVGPQNVSLLYVLEHNLMVFIVVRRDAREKLVDDDAKSPPVQGLVMATPIQHFWGHIFRSPTECVTEVSLLSKTKVR